MELTGSQTVKKFPVFYGTRRFTTAFTRARNLSVSWARSIQSMPFLPVTRYTCYFYATQINKNLFMWDVTL